MLANRDTAIDGPSSSGGRPCARTSTDVGESLSTVEIAVGQRRTLITWPEFEGWWRVDLLKGRSAADRDDLVAGLGSLGCSGGSLCFRSEGLVFLDL